MCWAVAGLVGGVVCAAGGYALVSGWISAVLGGWAGGLPATVCEAAVSAVFLVWSGWILSAKRIPGVELIPFGITGAVLVGVYSWGATLYLPRLFNSYADRYGVVGAVFAMLSALFAAMLVIVASAVLGREVSEELARIRQGLRPSEHEVRRQWEDVLEQARARAHGARGRGPSPWEARRDGTVSGGRRGRRAGPAAARLVVDVAGRGAASGARHDKLCFPLPGPRRSPWLESLHRPKARSPSTARRAPPRPTTTARTT
ncbi:hypothetical protein QFZ66_000483 [Streptomyces sp. B4I13]|uniref:hypothetical protein n=1 Tax=Streptomyces sp. B4I13 TaxID=3042271 RepID=UPI002786CC37|nr:hypothetical protein [Streptomyces sp. B4I13]MDQ0956605.1 hypothetical protein [Streptomyces sp. B4I13]